MKLSKYLSVTMGSELSKVSHELLRNNRNINYIPSMNVGFHEVITSNTKNFDIFEIGIASTRNKVYLFSSDIVIIFDKDVSLVLFFHQITFIMINIGTSVLMFNTNGFRSFSRIVFRNTKTIGLIII